MKKTWKKCCSLIVAAGMVFALAACSSGTAAPSADTEKETEAPADVSAVDSVEDSDDASADLSVAAAEEASATLSAEAAAFSTAAAPKAQGHLCRGKSKAIFRLRKSKVTYAGEEEKRPA